LMLTFASIGFVLREDRPDFNKADKGFEPRGTVIGGKMKVSKNTHTPWSHRRIPLFTRVYGEGV